MTLNPVSITTVYNSFPEKNFRLFPKSLRFDCIVFQTYVCFLQKKTNISLMHNKYYIIIGLVGFMTKLNKFIRFCYHFRHYQTLDSNCCKSVIKFNIENTVFNLFCYFFMQKQGKFMENSN